MPTYRQPGYTETREAMMHALREELNLRVRGMEATSLPSHGGHIALRVIAVHPTDLDRAYRVEVPWVGGRSMESMIDEVVYEFRQLVEKSSSDTAASGIVNTAARIDSIVDVLIRDIMAHLRENYTRAVKSNVTYEIAHRRFHVHIRTSMKDWHKVLDERVIEDCCRNDTLVKLMHQLYKEAMQSLNLSSSIPQHKDDSVKQKAHQLSADTEKRLGEDWKVVVTTDTSQHLKSTDVTFKCTHKSGETMIYEFTCKIGDYEALGERSVQAMDALISDAEALGLGPKKKTSASVTAADVAAALSALSKHGEPSSSFQQFASAMRKASSPIRDITYLIEADTREAIRLVIERERERQERLIKDSIQLAKAKKVKNVKEP